jgi:hypothetical protein
LLCQALKKRWVKLQGKRYRIPRARIGKGYDAELSQLAILLDNLFTAFG